MAIAKQDANYNKLVIVFAITMQSIAELFGGMRQNIVVVGLMPWMGKEPQNMSPFLRPIVDDFLKLWNGVNMCTSRFPQGTLIKAALLGTSSDTPATRKLNGFMSFNAVKGCSKCTIKLGSRQTCKSVRDYGKTFDDIKLPQLDPNKASERCLPWNDRSAVRHRAVMKELSKINGKHTKSAHDKLIRDTGYKPTDLLRLPYFDSIRFHAIDVMHALYEGVAKRIFETWVQSGQLPESKLEILDKRIASIRPPPDFERLPRKISSSFRSFKAIEWMHFVLHYSQLCIMGDLIPTRWLHYWDDFVTACRILTRTELSKEEAAQLTYFFARFAKKFKQEHKNDSITPNFHLCLHIEKCVLDYGPVYSFWLFGFERYNGLLGKYPVNGHRDVEIQMMRRFYTQAHVESIKSHVTGPLKSILDTLFMNGGDEMIEQNVSNQINLWRIRKFGEQSTIPASLELYSDLVCYKLPSRFKRVKLPERNLKFLLESYQAIYPSQSLSMNNLSENVKFYNSVTVGSAYYPTGRANTKDAYVLANYCPLENPSVQCAYVHRFMVHELLFDGRTPTQHIFALVTWYPDAPSTGNPYGSHVVLCDVSRFAKSGACTYVPIQRILARCLSSVDVTCSSYRAIIPCVNNSA